MAKITIDDKSYLIEGDDVTLNDVFEAMLSVLTEVALGTIAQAPEEDRDQARTQISGLLSDMFTDVLAVINPTLTHTINEETLNRSIQVQDAFIMAALEELKETNPELYEKRMAVVDELIRLQAEKAAESVAAQTPSKVVQLYGTPEA